MSSDKKPLTVITIQGPTASGKSSLAMKLAEELNTEIISADSRQVYKYLDIGTAKPSRSDQKRIKHHLIDIIEPDQFYNAGKFSSEAEIISRKLNSKQIIPLIVGGTGFYVKALISGLAQIPDISDLFNKSIIKKYSEITDAQLHSYLTSFDPLSAERIDIQDRQKILRAISVFEFSGKPISSYWSKIEKPVAERSFNILITEERDILYNKINLRIDKMIQNGLLDEIEELLKKGFKKTDPGMRSVGYQEFIPYFENNAQLTKCIELAKQHTRNYAKRQFTWLKKCEFDLTLHQNNINFSQVLEAINISNLKENI